MMVGIKHNWLCDRGAAGGGGGSGAVPLVRLFPLVRLYPFVAEVVQMTLRPLWAKSNCTNDGDELDKSCGGAILGLLTLNYLNNPFVLGNPVACNNKFRVA